MKYCELWKKWLFWSNTCYMWKIFCYKTAKGFFFSSWTHSCCCIIKYCYNCFLNVPLGVFLDFISQCRDIQGKVVNFLTLLYRVFIPLSIDTRSVKIHPETWELWSKIKWHIFMAYGVYTSMQYSRPIPAACWRVMSGVEAERMTCVNQRRRFVFVATRCGCLCELAKQGGHRSSGLTNSFSTSIITARFHLQQQQ